MKKITKKTLIEKGIEEPKGMQYCHYFRTYCKIWSVSNFYLRINRKGNVEIFEGINGELIKTIKDEKILDAFILFAKH